MSGTQIRVAPPAHAEFSQTDQNLEACKGKHETARSFDSKAERAPPHNFGETVTGFPPGQLPRCSQPSPWPAPRKQGANPKDLDTHVPMFTMFIYFQALSPGVAYGEWGLKGYSSLFCELRR